MIDTMLIRLAPPSLMRMERCSCFKFERSNGVPADVAVELRGESAGCFCESQQKHVSCLGLAGR